MSTFNKPLARCALGLLVIGCGIAVGAPARAASPKNTAYVTQVLTDLYLLGSPPNYELINSWATALDNGTPITQFARTMVYSVNFGDVVMDSAYPRYLNRYPQNGDYNVWKPYWNGSGRSIQGFFNVVASSTEYFEDCDSDIPTFIMRLYEDILGRTPSNAEVAFWAGIMNGDDSDQERSDVAWSFIGSEEFRHNWVVKLYKGLLRRDPDPAGLVTWETDLHNGSNLEDVIVGFITSAEYYNHGLYYTPPFPGWGGAP